MVTTAAGQRVEELGRRSSYTFQLEALAAHLREGAPLPIEANDAVEMMELIDDCYLAAGFSPRPRKEPNAAKGRLGLALSMAPQLMPRRKRTRNLAWAP